MKGTTARKLTMSPAWLDAVKPEATPTEYRDLLQRGLVLRVEVSGRKTWVVRYWFKGRDRRYTIGTYPETKLKPARKAAQGKLGTASSGKDPQAEVERLRIGSTVAEAVKAWKADTKLGPAAKWKGGLENTGSARAFLPHVGRFVREMGSRKLVELEPKHIERFASVGEAAATRNRALTALRGFFAWASRKKIVEADPTAGLAREREKERSRTLTDAELRALVLGFDATRYGRAVRLLALAALRRDEVLGARWDWLDSKADPKVMTIPPEAEKSGRMRGEPRRVALSPQAAALLKAQRETLFAEGLRDSDFIFATTTGERPHRDALKPILYGLRGRRTNGQPASKHKLAKARPVVLGPDADGVLASIHDVRRTVADALLNRLGVAPWVVDHVVLGHVRPKLLRTYMPTLPLEEARAALTKWAEELERIVSGESAAKAEK